MTRAELFQTKHRRGSLYIDRCVRTNITMRSAFELQREVSCAEQVTVARNRALCLVRQQR
jgi:hypothetical protein